MDERRKKSNLKLFVIIMLVAATMLFLPKDQITDPTEELRATESAEGSQTTGDEQSVDSSGDANSAVAYTFANQNLLQEHFEKHGVAMGFESAEEYEKAASDVINNPASLHKTESEDGDDVYYLESSNELVIVSTRGYIRTYFLPDDGKAYFDRT